MSHLFLITSVVRFGAMGLLLAGALYTKHLSQTRRRLWPMYTALALAAALAAGEMAYSHQYRQQHPSTYPANRTD